MNSKYDVIIVGSGPAGLAAAKNLKRFKVLLLDKGKRNRTSLTSGFGGSGLFADGKLIVSDVIGGWIRDYCEIDVNGYLSEALSLFGKDLKPQESSSENSILPSKASQFRLNLLSAPTYHLGTDGCVDFTNKIYDELSKSMEIRLETDIFNFKQKEGGYVVEATNGDVFYSKYLILAPGRGGADWLASSLSSFGVSCLGNEVDLGVRVELPSEIVKNLVDFNWDFKLHYYAKPFDDRVRSFCVCPYGFVTKEDTGELITCNGHSFKSKKSKNTNFSLLVSIPFSVPIDPVQYGKSVVSLANNIANSGIIVQRLSDLIQGRRSTADRINKGVVKPTLVAYPGDLSLVLPFRYLNDIIEMLKAMDNISPGVYTGDTLLYGVEVKFYSNKIKLRNMEVPELPNLFCIGDGAGVSRGIIQAAASGLIASDEVMKRIL
jgi:uncharacterized FAD-dependent dehydrogenase